MHKSSRFVLGREIEYRLSLQHRMFAFRDRCLLNKRWKLSRYAVQTVQVTFCAVSTMVTEQKAVLSFHLAGEPPRDKSVPNMYNIPRPTFQARVPLYKSGRQNNYICHQMKLPLIRCGSVSSVDL